MDSSTGPSDASAAASGERASAPVPARIGRYRVLGRIGQGGMAEVFLAETTDLPGVRRIVVVKRLLPELQRDREHMEMFLNEARIAASLGHPNVVQTIEVGEHNGEVFIAMEHVEGQSLAGVAASGRLPLGICVHVLSGVLAGLHYVHERTDEQGRSQQLIHRDVTPRNVLIGFDGSVKLIDFGIARPSSRLTTRSIGRIRGTVPYMSPEQCQGQHLDRRTDVFSAGIVLFELTTGRRLFDAGGDFQVFKQIVEGVLPRPTDLDPSYPPGLEHVVLRALERKPADRYATAGLFLADLEDIATQLGLLLSPRALQQLMAERFERQIASWRRALKTDDATRSASLTALGGATAGEGTFVGAARFSPQPRRLVRSLLLAALVVALTTGGVATWVRRTSRASPPSVAQLVPAAPPQPTSQVIPSPPSASPAPVEASQKRTPPPVTRPGPVHPHARAAPVPAPAPAPQSKPPASAAPTPTTVSLGTLVLEAQPWCDVTIDGNPQGPTPVSITVQPGKHTLRFRSTEFGIDRAIELTVAPGEKVRRRFDFAH